MHRRPEIEKEEGRLPPLATIIALGVWMAVFLALALFVVPLLFAPCTANIPET